MVKSLTLAYVVELCAELGPEQHVVISHALQSLPENIEFNFISFLLVLGLKSVLIQRTETGNKPFQLTRTENLSLQ